MFTLEPPVGTAGDRDRSAPTLPASSEAPLVFVTGCRHLEPHRAHLERTGFRLATAPSVDCQALVLCADDLEHASVAATVAAPKVVVGGDPPAGWGDAQRADRPLLPIDLESRLRGLLARDAAHGGTTYRILIVDDDAVVRVAATAAFRRAGFEVRAVGGFATVQAEMARHPDVVLVDLNLPGLSGEKLGEILHRQGVAIAVLSSAPSDRLEAARQSTGAFAAFPKGVSLHEVAATVRRHLDHAK